MPPEASFAENLAAAQVGNLRAGPARRALLKLRGESRWPELRQLAAALRAAGPWHPEIDRIEAQACIETKVLDEAEALLRRAREEVDHRIGALTTSNAATAPHESLLLREERSEIQGLLGRVAKQRYVNANPSRRNPCRELAAAAVALYEAEYRAAPNVNLWHGINVVALLSQQHRFTASQPAIPEPRVLTLASEILERIDNLESDGALSIWQLAIRFEALLAANAPRTSLEAALASYLGHPDLDLFKLESLRRQLCEVWAAQEQPELGPWLFDGIESRRIELSGSVPGAASAGRQPAGTLQSTAALTTTTPTLQALGRSVARIGSISEVGSGTGFLFDGGQIWPGYAGPPLLLTNAHVVSDKFHETSANPAALHPTRVHVTFFDVFKGTLVPANVRWVELIWTSPRNELDATLLMLHFAPDGAHALTPAPAIPSHGMARVIGFPHGGVQQVPDHRPIGTVGDRYIHYATETAPGNSGSPVFDDNWNLIAIHRAFASDADLNFGVRIDRIVAAIKAAIRHPPQLAR